MTEAQEAIQRWDQFALQFAELMTPLGDKHRIATLNPALFQLLEPTAGQHILDAGCGEGYLSRLLADQGAIVTAVDFSQAMLRIARERTPADLQITYHHGNCENMPFLASAQFDAVISNMVIMDLPNYQAAIAEAFRLLKPDGRYIFSILHPCFCVPGGSWVRDAEQHKLYWRVDRYFDEGRYQQPITDAWSTPLFGYHRTLTAYIQTIVATGFVIEVLHEPRPTPEAIAADPELQDGLRIPDFLIFKLRKP